MTLESGWKASALGFGCMRLPTRGSYEDIDEPEAVRMLRTAIDRGVNYVDTAYGYHGGNSERLVGKALKDGYREKVRVATKMPMWRVKQRSDLDKLFNEQLERLQDDYIDLYLLHGLNRKRWELAKRLDITGWAEKVVQDGGIGCIGFSFHDDYEVFEDIINEYDGWTFCQIQYNYMNEEHQAGTKGLELAADNGLAVVIMEPLLGGNLVDPPEAIARVWEDSGRDWTPAEWALRWLWNKPGVSVVLSGMSTMRQVEENVRSADRSKAGVLTDEDLETVETVRSTYQTIRPIPCTQCQYCMPCPYGVNIPRNLQLYNIAQMYNQLEQQRKAYAGMDESMRADQCTACRDCETKCPQNIEISEWMRCIRDELGTKAAAT